MQVTLPTCVMRVCMLVTSTSFLVRMTSLLQDSLAARRSQEAMAASRFFFFSIVLAPPSGYSLLVAMN